MTVRIVVECKDEELEKLLLCLSELSPDKEDQKDLLRRATHWITASQAAHYGFNSIKHHRKIQGCLVIDETPLSTDMPAGSSASLSGDWKVDQEGHRS